MERRDRDTDGGLESGGLENSAKSKAWQAVRRALGRLVSHVGVRTVEQDQRTILAPVIQANLALPPPKMPAGDKWKPSSIVCLAPVPQAGTGSQESSLLPTVTLAQGDYALTSPVLQAMPVAGAETVGLQSVSLEWPIGVTHLPDSFVRLPSSPVRLGMVSLLPLPKAKPLRGWNMPMPPVSLLPLPRLAEPRIRWGGDSVLSRMPLTRRGMTPRSQSSPSEAFAAEHQRLAETVHLKPEEIILLGIYPDVPILAVERILVEDEGRQLRLWLKPDVLRGRSGAHRITLLVGRQTATGKMLQAAL